MPSATSLDHRAGPAGVVGVGERGLGLGHRFRAGALADLQQLGAPAARDAVLGERAVLDGQLVGGELPVGGDLVGRAACSSPS